jgi:hypothetical protein
LQLIGQVPWLTSVILVTRKTELRKISIWSQPRQKVHATPISTNKS